MREGRTPDPEPYDCVTVIFCDLVDYNLLSAALQPHQVRMFCDVLLTYLAPAQLLSRERTAFGHSRSSVNFLPVVHPNRWLMAGSGMTVKMAHRCW